MIAAWRWMLVSVCCCVLLRVGAGCAANSGKIRLSPSLLTTTLARVGKLEARVGDIAIGGEGDSVVSWILAVGLVLSLPGGGLFYQHVLRPLRLKKNGGARRRMCDE